MGTSPETKKRKAPSEAWCARPAKTRRTSRHEADCTSHCSYTASITRTTSHGPHRQRVAGNALRVIDRPVVGPPPGPLRAGTAPSSALDTATDIELQPSTEGDARMPCMDEIGGRRDGENGQLSVAQHHTLPSNPYHRDAPSGLRTGEPTSASAPGLQQMIPPGSVFVVATRAGRNAFLQKRANDAETTAIHSSAHEANQHVLKEFWRWGGFQKHRRNADPDEMCVADELEYGEEPSFCFVNGLAQARIVRGVDFMLWEVYQQNWP